jgi:hypothetical protein
LTLVILLFSVVGGAAQTYTQMQWGMNKGVTPYAFGANINGSWSNLGTVSSAGVWSIPSTNLSFTQAGIGAVTTTVNTKLRTLPVRPEEFGAVADCSTDNTLAIQRAINAGSTIEFQDTGACYLTDTVVINATSAKKIVINPGVVIKRKTGTCGDAQVFNVYLSPGTEFSGGGTIDGNRAAFTGCIPIFNAGWMMDGIVIRSSDITVKDISFVNVVRHGINAAFSDRLRLENLTFSNSGTGMLVQFLSGLSVSNIYQSSMGNVGFPIYQHLNDIRGVSDSSVDGFYITSWNPDRAGLEPVPGALGFQATRTNVSNVSISGFSGTGGVGTLHSLSEGFTVPTCVDSKFENIAVSGNAYSNISVGGAIRCQFSNVTLYDGTYQAKNFFLASNSYQNTDVTTSALDAVGVDVSHDITISDLISSGGAFGLDIRAGENVTVTNAVLTNNEYGVSVQCSNTNMSIPNPIPQCSKNVAFANVKVATNSYCGFYLDGYDNISVDSASHVYNNGQKSDLGALFRAGVCIGPLAASKNLNLSSGAFMGDTQNITLAAAASYKPGATDAKKQYKVTLINPDGIQPGQYITLKDAAGAGSNITARVIALNDNVAFKTEGGVSSFGGNVDQITVETAAPATFSASAVSTALAGTVSSSGTTVTGVGTSFSSVIRGHAWLCVASNCARVARVNSNTQIITETPFAPALSGATVSLIAADVLGIPSQSYALAAQAGAAVGPISYGRLSTTGVTTAAFYFANLALSAPYGAYNTASWTPSDASGASLALTVPSAQCTRSGNSVECQFSITWPVNASAAQAVIGGLPYTDNTSANAQAGGSATYTDYVTPFTILTGNASKTMAFYTFGGVGLTNTDLSGKTIRGVVRYMTYDPPL